MNFAIQQLIPIAIGTGFIYTALVALVGYNCGRIDRAKRAS